MPQWSTLIYLAQRGDPTVCAILAEPAGFRDVDVFYGIPRDRFEAFKGALSVMREAYPNQMFSSDMLITFWKLMSFTSDRKFMESFTSTAATEKEHSLIWRLHVLVWAASHATHVAGDFIECGVFHGFCSRVVCKYLDFGRLGRQFFLYDTFSGLPEVTSSEEERRFWNPEYQSLDGDALYREVSSAFASWPNVRIVRGMVPESFAVAQPEKIAFLHVDMNSERAETLALEALFDRVVPGGVIVLDDFGWQCNRNQNVAERAFMQARNHPILEIPTGQAIVIKHGSN